MQSRTWSRASRWLGCFVVLALGGWLAAAPATAQEDREGAVRELHEVLEGLEYGMVALERLEQRELFERLEQVAASVRRELRQTERGQEPRAERRGNDRRSRDAERDGASIVESMRLVLPALMEAERHDFAELLERAIRAREMTGRRDAEARGIRRASPGLEDQIEIMLVARELWDEFGHEGKVEVMTDAIKRLRVEGRSDRARPRDRPQGGAVLERVERIEDRLANLERSLERVLEMLERRDH